MGKFLSRLETHSRFMVCPNAERFRQSQEMY